MSIRRIYDILYFTYHINIRKLLFWLLGELFSYLNTINIWFRKQKKILIQLLKLSIILFLIYWYYLLTIIFLFFLLYQIIVIKWFTRIKRIIVYRLINEWKYMILIDDYSINIIKDLLFKISIFICFLSKIDPPQPGGVYFIKKNK